MNTMMKKKYQSPATEVLNLDKDYLLLLAGSEPGTSTGSGSAHSRGYSADGWDGEDY